MSGYIEWVTIQFYFLGMHTEPSDVYDNILVIY